MVDTKSQNSTYGQGDKKDWPARITKAGSKQTYYTFLLLADRDRVQDAFRSYAYYRWLDDLLDCDSGTKEEKTDLLQRQQTLLEACYQRIPPGEVGPEEQMLVDLILTDMDKQSGLQLYLRNMMAVMAFDVERCGRKITNAELTEYTRLLSTAVTELLFYLIGHKDAPKSGEYRYHAVNGAHIVHMLRDMCEDISAGYINLPGDYIQAHQISFEELHSYAIREWVFERVKLARKFFQSGRSYIAQVKNFRCRLAGFAYLSRFEYMLRLIERDGYCLQLEYPERKSLWAGLWMGWRTIISTLNIRWIKLDLEPQAALIDRCEER
jgi:phytoene/squalene synthetase